MTLKQLNLVEAKKLRFNEKKSVNMHIGPNEENCPQLKAHEFKMKNVQTQLYLGDMISNTGNNNENIKNRVKKGYSTIAQIKSLLKCVGFGRFDVPTGLLMRDTIFVSKMLLNSEVWHSVTKSQIDELEIIDRNLIRQILNAHSKTGIEWLYIDTGKFNLKSLIQIRRLMYLWHILKRNKTELIRRVYEAQKIFNNKGDFIKLIEADKKELEMNINDEEISSTSQKRFKDYVKSKVKIHHLNFLHNMKQKHTKSKFLKFSDLKTAEYLKDPEFNTREKHILFKLRSRTLDVKMNFRGQHKDVWCISCGLFPEFQSHLLQCPQLVVRLNYLAGKTSRLNENDIYKDVKRQKVIVSIYSDILEVREKLKNQSEQEYLPLTQRGPIALSCAA